MKKLLALLFALLATPAAAQTIPSGAWGSINYWGVGGLSQVLAPGLAGQCLTSQNVGSAPIWVNCQVSSLSLLPSISANSIMANNTLNFVAPQAIDVNRVLDMVGYDIIRPPVAESIIYKSNVGPNFNWQTLPPGTSGALLTSGGPTNPPFWAPTATQANLASICTTVGAVLYFDTPSLLWKCLNPGTSGQLLQTGGPAGNPSWLTVTLATLGGVPSTRNVNTTAPLGGGGALSADLTLTCATCATTAFVTSAIRERLAADRTYFVRTDGNDNNTGLVNSAGGAFLTIGRAIAIVGQTLDLNGFNLTIQVGDGTYNESPSLIPYLGRTSQGHFAPTAVVIQGNHSTPANVVVNGGFTAVEAGLYEWILRDFKIVSGAANAVNADVGGWIVIDNINFGTTTANHMVASFGYVEPVTSYTVSGGAANHMLSANTGNIIVSAGITVTLTGTPAFSGAFTQVLTGGTLTIPAGTVFSGAATGTRWLIDATGSISGVAGDNASLNAMFPGNANGAYTALAVARGGTGVLTSTGSGSVVLSTSPALVTPALGTPASGVGTNLTGIPNGALVNSAITISGKSTALGTSYSPFRGQTLPSNPTGTTSGAQVMAGLAGSFTPATSGNIHVMVQSTIANSIINDGCIVQMRFGTGGAPANGAAATGTAIGQQQSAVSFAANAQNASSLTAYVTGLTPSTVYWFDLGFAAVTGGTCSPSGIVMDAFEQ